MNLVAQVSSSRSITFQWEPPNFEEQNGIITGYIINISAIGAEEEMFQLSLTIPSLVVEELRPFTTYICRVAARTVVGIGPYSNTVTAVTLQEGESNWCLSYNIIA